jgi:conjugal transfer pilus assembly protein TraL
MENGKGWFPRYFDSPIQILWWEIDEILPLFLMLMIGLFFGSFLFCAVIGFVLFWLITKYKKNLPNGYIGNILYMTGLRRIKGYPSYLENKFRE